MEKVKVNFLVRNFHSALVSLTPNLDAIGIPWRDLEEQYDEYDEIAESLFKSLVVQTISYSMQDPKLANHMIYGMRPEHIHDGSYLNVTNTTTSQPVGRFIEFATKADPYDQIVILQEDDKTGNGVFTFVDYGESLDFTLSYGDGPRSRKNIAELVLQE